MHRIVDSISAVNALLRGELSATETYQQALQKLNKGPAADHLWRIHHEHREAANTLRQEVHRLGGKPDQNSGAWGAWAKLVEGTAKLLGETAALKALKEGEGYGLKSYEAALADETIPDETKALIRSSLLPSTREHIAALDRLINTAK
jgi:uncharacterized protein (TIGR02284 family)